MTNSPSLSTAVCLMHLFCGYLTILSSLPGNIEGFDARHASSLSYYRSRLPAAAARATTTTTTTTTNNNNNHRSSLKYAITTMAATNTQQNKIANKANNNRRNFIGTTASSVAAMMTAIFPQQQQQQVAHAADVDVDVDADTVTVTGTESNNNDGSISSLSTSSTGTSSGSDVDTGRDGIISSKYCAYGMGDGCADLAEGNDFIKKLQAKSATNKESAQMVRYYISISHNAHTIQFNSIQFNYIECKVNQSISIQRNFNEDY